MLYFAHLRHMLRKPSKPSFYIGILLLWLGAATAQQPSPSPLVTAADGLVQDILSRAGSPSTVALSFQNVSQIPADVQETVQNAVFNGLRGAGVRLVKPEMAVADVKIIFSENWQRYLWIGVIQQGPSQQLVMRTLPRAERPAPPRMPVLTLHKDSLWQQDEPILDFYADNQNLVILEPSQLVIYAEDSGQWRERSTLAITHGQVWPRDLRGRLRVEGFQITASLPGTLCSGRLAPPSLDCRASDDPWPLDAEQLAAFYSGRRNFFNGILAGPDAGASVIPFFSAATWPSRDQRQWLFTGTDGRARLYQGDLSAPVAVFNGWGSNAAVIHSGCGPGWQLLASAPSDSIHPDTLQALEIAGREAQPVSPVMDLPGAISAMWSSGENNGSVNVVMQSPDTGKYEAMVLTVRCH